jgi:uncharacterized protein, YfiH family
MQISFDKYPQVNAGLSERSDGSMVWWNRLPVDEIVRKNRDEYFQRLNIKPGQVVAGGIAHGNHAAVVDIAEAGKYILNTDGLLTNKPGIYLSITAADCLPVYFFDPVTNSIGVAHAGWRGLVAGILENVIKEFQNTYGSKPENIQVIIGPHIQGCHYEVGAEVAEQFSEKNIEERDGHLYAKLGAEAMLRLNNLGVKDIFVSSECTYENPQKFYSARYDKSEPLQGMVAYLGLRK